MSDTLPNTESDLRHQLRAQEQLLWVGSPRQGWALRPTDMLLIPFSIMWGGFALVWEIGVVSSGAPLLFVLWGIPLVLIGLYITVGRFWVDARVRARTQYGLTDDRILISTGRSGSASLTTLPLESLSTITLKERSDSSGTINFGGGLPFLHFYASYHLPGMSALLPTQFEMIENARSVYDQILQARGAVRH